MMSEYFAIRIERLRYISTISRKISPIREEGEQMGFREALLETLDSTLTSLLGETGRSLIYGYLKTTYGLRRDEFPNRFETLLKGLREIFSSGARGIEDIIIDAIFSELERNQTIKE